MSHTCFRTIRLGYLRLTQSTLQELRDVLRERISTLPETDYERSCREYREATRGRADDTVAAGSDVLLSLVLTLRRASRGAQREYDSIDALA